MNSHWTRRRMDAVMEVADDHPARYVVRRTCRGRRTVVGRQSSRCDGVQGNLTTVHVGGHAATAEPAQQ